MKLSPEERARLGERLLGSVPPVLEFEEEWVREVDRRVDEIRTGAVRAVPSEEMFRRALEGLD